MALQVLSRMEAAGLVPNVVTYTTLMTAYSRSADVDGAESVLQRMKAANVKPNILSYNSLLTAMYWVSKRQVNTLDDAQV